MDFRINSLNEGNIRIQSLIEHLHTGIIVHDPDTSVLFSNQAASRLLGLSEEQMLGKMADDPCWNFLKVDGTPLSKDEHPVMKAINHLQPVDNYTIGIIRPDDGTRIWALASALPELDDQQQLSQVIVTIVDITEQKEIYEAFSESELKFSKVFYDSPGIVVITSIRKGIIIDANHKIGGTGYSREELIGQSVLNLDLWKNLSDRDQYVAEISAKGRVENFEACFKKKSGEINTCLLSGEVIRLDKAECLVNLLINITERKQIELEMKVLSEIVEGVVRTADLNELLKLIHDSLKKVLYAENCFFSLYDPDKDLFNFPYFVDRFDDPPSSLPLTKSCTRYVFQTGKSIIITPEKFNQLKEQNEITLFGSWSPSWIGVPLQTSSRIIGVLVLQNYDEENIYNDHHLQFLDSIGSQVANVIERKRAENELEKSFSLIAATLESTADGILVVNKDRKITNYNDKFVQLWQIPEEVIRNRDYETFLAFGVNQLKDPVASLDKIYSLIENDEETSFDILEFVDGRTFERYSQSQIFEGRSVGRVWSYHDVTDQKKTLQALYDSQARLYELNATKDKFFSIIAHDLKSPFSSILGFTNILAEQIKMKDFDGAEEYAEIIQQSSQKAMDLLTNLIEWSRSQSGRMDFNPEFIEVGILINEICDLANAAAKQKSILLLTDLPHHLSAFIDRSMISSVIRNLISNAIKFTHPGGTVVIKAEQRKQKLQVSITDNGIGVEPSDLKKLFSIDENFSVPGTLNEKGTGLGLVLCKEFIDKHKGRIWAESEPGKGSRFIFTIPK